MSSAAIGPQHVQNQILFIIIIIGIVYLFSLRPEKATRIYNF